jgi:hypothetical protein
MAGILRMIGTGLIAVLPFASVLAQEFKFQAEVDSIHVDNNGVTVHSPFTGGYSISKPALVDIDDDGDLDLFVGDSFGTVAFYRNAGTDNAPIFKQEREFIASIDVGDDSAPAFADIDNDGDFDLFAGSKAGTISLFQNTGTTNDYNFVLQTDSFGSVLVGASSAPAFADIDNDGDQDLFVGDKNAKISFYRNTGTPEAPAMTLENDSLAIVPGNFGVPALSDIDNDSDVDLFIGEDAGNLNFFRNTGAAGDSMFVLETENFSTINSGDDSAPAFGDLDGDGDLDLLVAEFLGNINFYRNTGTPALPDFSLEIENFASIDVGSNSAPVFVDIDDDGDPDLFLGENSGSINYYKNVGNDSIPAYSLVTENLASTAGPMDVGSFSTCTFADIDNDGDHDLFVGELDGNVNFYRNTGTIAAPEFTINAASLGGIDVGSNSAPALIDIDQDGDVDLFVGERDGNINFYRNTGTAADPVFTLEAEKYLSIDVGSNSTPAFLDCDDDGDYDMFVGKDRGTVSFYRNTGTLAEPAFALETGSLDDIDIGSDSAPALADIDNDGDIDMFLGERDGGLYFFRRIPGNPSAVTLADEDGLPNNFELGQNYPNPFNPETMIRYYLPKPSTTRLIVYNLIGQKVTTLVNQEQPAGLHSIQWNGNDDAGRNVSSGVYFIRLEAGDFAKSRKLLLLR